MKLKQFFLNSVILTATSILLRLSNIGFRTFICAQIGASGMGVYQLIFSVFFMMVILSTSGSSLAATRIVAEGRGTHSSLRQCLIFALGVSFSAAAVLFLVSDTVAIHLLGIQSGLPLRLLAPSLPFMGVCSCLRGYFMAKRNSVVPSVTDAVEQLITIGSAVLLIQWLTPLSALMLSSTIGEVISCACIWCLFRADLRKSKPPREKGENQFPRIFHIALPVMGGTFTRSLLNSTENLLIPRGLKSNGANATDALSQYGMIQGMVWPILLFPSSFLSSLAYLLIPELAEANARGNRLCIQKSTARAFRLTLIFSFFITAVLIVYAEDLCGLFYDSPQAGIVLRIMAPIIPLMYVDSIVDGMLKGLDQQLYSFRYNIIDSVLRVSFIAVFVPMYGMKAYLAMLFLSEIFNASLSINRLLKVTKIEVNITEWIIAPAVCAGLFYYFLIFLRRI